MITNLCYCVGYFNVFKCTITKNEVFYNVYIVRQRNFLKICTMIKSSFF